MKTAALAANLALLVVMAWYASNLADITANGMELLVSVFAFASPIGNILALLTRRGFRRAVHILAGITNIFLLVTMITYLIAHHRVQDFDMEWLELLVFVCMFFAPVLSIIALAFGRQADGSTKSESIQSCVAEKQ
jgi:peptidoglycan/LPS O-acetylase OafA/YrhL